MVRYDAMLNLSLDLHYSIGVIDYESFWEPRLEQQWYIISPDLIRA